MNTVRNEKHFNNLQQFTHLQNTVPLTCLYGIAKHCDHETLEALEFSSPDLCNIVERNRTFFRTARVVRVMEYVRFQFGIPEELPQRLTLTEAGRIERAMQNRKAYVRLNGQTVSGKIISWTQPCDTTHDAIIILRRDRAVQSYDTFLQPRPANVAIPLTGADAIAFPTA